MSSACDPATVLHPRPFFLARLRASSGHAGNPGPNVPDRAWLIDSPSHKAGRSARRRVEGEKGPLIVNPRAAEPRGGCAAAGASLPRLKLKGEWRSMRVAAHQFGVVQDMVLHFLFPFLTLRSPRRG